MTLWIRLAWRNTFRNKRRTFITGIAIGIGLASLIFVDALVIGMNDNLVQAATSTFLGDAQIHARGFRQSQDVETVIHDHARVENELSTDPAVKQFTSRVMAYGMITSPADAGSVAVVGIDPSPEKNISEIDENIMQGTFFAENSGREIVIGSKLAEILGVGVGDKVVVTVAQAHSGDLSQDMLRVSGIYRFGIDEMDRGMAFVRLSKAQEMLGLGDDIHEIAVQFKEAARPGHYGPAAFYAHFSRDGNEAVSWIHLMPQLKGALDLSDFTTLITGLLLFSIIAFGIINTLFMSLYERMFEFGVLRAVGTRPGAVARLILLEAACLAVVSIILGTALGWIVTSIVAHTGIDYTGIEYAGATFRRFIYPVMNVQQFIIYPLWVFVFTLTAALYPAIYAARMTAVEAMRRSL